MLIEAMREMAFDAPEQLGEGLWRFHGLLREADSELNLTRLRSFGAMVEKHYVDSLLPLRWWKPEGRVMDLGSGGGFPGMPLAIAVPQVQWVLVEGRRKRTAFLAESARRLGLMNVEVVSRKLNPLDCIEVDHAIVRAVARCEDLLDRLARSIPVDGTVALMKGPDCDDEIAAVRAMCLPFELADDVRYALPRSRDPRRLLVFRRIAGEWPLDAAERTGLSLPAGARRIESANNGSFKRWKQLLTGRGSRKYGETLLAGERFAEELLETVPQSVLGVLVREGSPPPEGLGEHPCYVVSAALFGELDGERTGGPIVWMRVPDMPAWEPADAEGMVLLVAMQNPDNVGAVLRSAEAFGATEVVLLEGAASPYQPKSLRASGPSAFRLPLRRGPGIDALDGSGLPLYGLQAGGEALRDVQPGPRFGLVVGREGAGLDGLPNAVVRVGIPMAAATESLNAAVAASVAMYALTPATR